MREWPESRVVLSLLTRVTRLRWLQAVVTGAAVGLAFGAVVLLLMLLNGGSFTNGVVVGLACALAGAGVAWMRCDRSESAAAAAVVAAAIGVRGGSGCLREHHAADCECGAFRAAARRRSRGTG